MRIGFIGCGFMGEAILSAVLQKEVATPADVRISDVNPQRCAYLADTYGVTAAPNSNAGAASQDLVIFAVKPQDFPEAAESCRHAIPPSSTLLSIVAGISMDAISHHLHHEGVVRVMPNTPAAVGFGMSVWTAAPGVPPAGREMVAQVLAAMGREIYVAEEKYLDMATALSASGPGFVYLLLEAFIDAGVHIGLKREVAVELAIQTFLGSAKYLDISRKHPAELRNAVTSPAGTTAEGLLVLERAGVRTAVIEAIEAAYRRTKQLGEAGASIR